MIWTVLYRNEPQGKIHASPEVTSSDAANTIADGYRAGGRIVVKVGAEKGELKRLGLWIGR
jgi:hypothetical protein